MRRRPWSIACLMVAIREAFATWLEADRPDVLLKSSFGDVGRTQVVELPCAYRKGISLLPRRLRAVAARLGSTLSTALTPGCCPLSRRLNWSDDEPCLPFRSTWQSNNATKSNSERAMDLESRDRRPGFGGPSFRIEGICNKKILYETERRDVQR